MELLRFPEGGNVTLQAWDAADEYVLGHLADLAPKTLGDDWLLVNDAFGALAVALADRGPRSWSDSFLAHEGARANLVLNERDPDSVVPVRSTEDLTGPVDVAVIKIPRTLALLEDQLHRLSPHLHSGSVVVGAGMTRNIHNSTSALFERYIGTTTTSLARKKARLIFSEVDKGRDLGPSSFPTSYELESGMKVVNHAGVFSMDRLDRGTSILMGSLPEPRGEIRILDMGCGNGVVGAIAALENQAAEIFFSDESYMAIASAEATFAGAMEKKRKATFLVADCADGIESGTVDLVLNNPPFHDRNAVDDAVAWRMFTEARRVLKPGSEVRVVGNRHLGYHIKLKKVFGNCRVVGSDPRFVVLAAIREP